MPARICNAAALSGWNELTVGWSDEYKRLSALHGRFLLPEHRNSYTDASLQERLLLPGRHK